MPNSDSNRNEYGKLRITRRRVLKLAGGVLGGLCANTGASAAERKPPSARKALMYPRYTDLLATLDKRGHKYRVLGHAPDRSPIVAVKAGGDKTPAIFISAGSHSTEHAGVSAAVELIDQLETEHQVWIIPTRDPIGLSGFQYALGLGLGEEPNLQLLDEVDDFLRAKGEVLLDKDGRLLVLIGEYGYANGSLYRRFKKGDAFLEPLRGRRLYFPSRWPDREGAGPLQRAYTQVVTPDGEVLHLNRFHDTAWAPSEIRCARRLMAEVNPGLTFDLHEYGGDAFWMSARHQNNPTDEKWEERMARAAIKAVIDSKAKVAVENYSPGSFFKKQERGVFWLEAKERGEGLNLIDFAARKYGPGFTIETGMRIPFQQRVELHKLVVRTAVREFERRFV